MYQMNQCINDSNLKCTTNIAQCENESHATTKNTIIASKEWCDMTIKKECDTMIQCVACFVTVTNTPV